MYDWKITLKKIGISLVEILIAGGLVYLTDKPQWIVLVPILEGLRNWWKYRKVE